MGDQEPARPRDVDDRTWDNWRPLFAVAEVAGGHWPARIRRACIKLTKADQDESEDRVLLLEDLGELFSTREREVWRTADLINELVELEERPWRDWKYGKPISPRQLAGLLKPFGIRPKEFREGGAVFRGYERAGFDDALGRYVS